MPPFAAPWCRGALPGHIHRVLVVDDEVMLRDILMELLQDEGYAVQSASNGATALAHAIQDPPCIALVDLMMPIMDGLELIRTFRANSVLKDLPIVAATAGHRRTAISMLPVDGFLGKPFDVHDLLAMFTTILGAAPGTPSSATGSVDGQMRDGLPEASASDPEPSTRPHTST